MHDKYTYQDDYNRKYIEDIKRWRKDMNIIFEWRFITRSEVGLYGQKSEHANKEHSNPI